MMRKEEQRLWDAMKRNKTPVVMLERVENVMNAGTPDVFLHVTRLPRSAWVELKARPRPARDSTRFLGREGLSTDQQNWHLAAASRGIVSWVLARDDEHNLFLVDGKFAAEVNEWSWGTLREGWRYEGWSNLYQKLITGCCA